MQVTVDAPAKINLTLNIEGIREDGYHLLSSVFQTVSLSDRVVITQTEKEGLALAMSDAALPCDERNTAYRAAKLFFEAVGIAPSVSIAVEKHIPQQAGLGGGSADAAGVLVGLNALYGEPLSLEQLCRVGERVGADVPFCIVGGTAMVTGIGEVIEPLPSLASCDIVIAKPPVGVSTKDAYRAVDSHQTIPADQTAMTQAIQSGDLVRVGSLLSNAFEQALAIEQVASLLADMRTFAPLGCMMSGSGSAVFALFDQKEKAQACAHSLQKSAQTYICAPLSRGAAVIG